MHDKKYIFTFPIMEYISVQVSLSLFYKNVHLYKHLLFNNNSSSNNKSKTKRNVEWNKFSSGKLQQLVVNKSLFIFFSVEVIRFSLRNRAGSVFTL